MDDYIWYDQYDFDVDDEDEYCEDWGDEIYND